MEKNSVEWWISRLKDRELAKKWMDNIILQKRTDFLSRLKPSLHEALQGDSGPSIVWNITEDKFSYWQSIAERMKKNPEEFLIPEEEGTTQSFKVGERVIVQRSGVIPVVAKIIQGRLNGTWEVEIEESKLHGIYYETNISKMLDQITIDSEEEFKIGDEAAPREGSKKGIIGKISQLQKSGADLIITVTFDDGYKTAFYNYQLILKKQLQSSHNKNQIYDKQEPKSEIVKTSRPVATVERAERPEGYSIQGKQSKAAITVQHLSYEGVFGS